MCSVKFVYFQICEGHGKIRIDQSKLEDIPKVGTALESAVIRECWLAGNGAWVKR